MSNIEAEAELALAYIENEQIDEMKVLAVIAGTVEAVGLKTFTRVFVDYLNRCQTTGMQTLALLDIAQDNGALEDEDE